MNCLSVDDSQDQRLALVAKLGILLSELAVAQSQVLVQDLVLEDPLGRCDVNIATVEVSNHRLVAEHSGGDPDLDLGQVVAKWWRQYQTCLVSIDNLHDIIVRNAELEVAFSGTLGQGQNPAQKRKLGEELRRVEGRVFGSWRVEVIVGRSICGCPFYQLLPVLPRVRRAHARMPGPSPTSCRAGLPRAARTREPGDDDEPPSPSAACEEQSTLPF